MCATFVTVSAGHSHRLYSILPPVISAPFAHRLPPSHRSCLSAFYRSCAILQCSNMAYHADLSHRSRVHSVRSHVAQPPSPPLFTPVIIQFYSSYAFVCYYLFPRYHHYQPKEDIMYNVIRFPGLIFIVIFSFYLVFTFISYHLS